MNPMTFLCRGILATAALCSLTFAQAPTPRPMVRMQRIEVKPDMVADWIDLQKQMTEYYKKAGIQRTVWRTGPFGDTYEFVIVSSMKYADYDGENPISKVATPQALASWAARSSKCLVSSRTLAIAAYPELGIGAPGGPPAKMGIFVTTRTRLGHDTEYQDLIKNGVAAAYKKAGVSTFLVGHITYGGPRDWISFRPIDKFADLEKNLIVASLGADGAAKLIEKLGAVTTTSNWVILRLREDLSYSAPPAR